MIHPGSKVHEILGRAMVDPEFRDRLYTDRASALATFDPSSPLEKEDLAILDGVSREQIEAHSAGIVFSPYAIIWPPSDPDPVPPPENPPVPPDPTPKPKPDPEPKPEPPKPPTPPSE
jgi:hypothetical protein